MEQDWVKAIGKKLREDLGDCPTLPQELVDALDRLKQTHLAGGLNGKASATTTRGKEAAPQGASGSYR